jgi:plasmanylethanolamine desaturase
LPNETLDDWGPSREEINLMPIAPDGIRTGDRENLEPSLASLPRHDDFSLARRVFEVAAIASAVCLLGIHVVRLFMAPHLEWWLVFVAVAGALGADLVSGIVHWAADTWGRETLPIIGRRLLRPFRVHHVNPDDFAGRRFLDVNGDVAIIVCLILAPALLLPLTTPSGRIADGFIVAFCLVGLPTNQVHQWAHIRRPPAAIRWLQRAGIILSPREHGRHHVAPYAEHYCIATGWCNRALAAIGFFPRLERLITRVTGVEPRADDLAFQTATLKSAKDCHDE